MTERYKLIAAANLILTRGNEILLSRRKNTGFNDGDYSIIGGHLEPGETIRQAMVREAKEEIGITIDPKNLRFVTLLHDWQGDGQRLQCFFHATKWTGDIINNEPNKSSDVRWFSFDALPENMVPDIKKTLEVFKAGETYVEWPS